MYSFKKIFFTNFSFKKIKILVFFYITTEPHQNGKDPKYNFLNNCMIRFFFFIIHFYWYDPSLSVSEV